MKATLRIAADACLAVLLLLCAVHLVTLIRNSFSTPPGVLFASRPGLWLPMAAVMYGLLLPLLALRFLPLLASSGRIRDGLAVGIAFGAWALATLIVVDYAGLYPSTPALLGAILLGLPNHGPAFWIIVYFANLMMWPLAGAGLVGLRIRLRTRGASI